MEVAIISGDIIAYTALSDKNKVFLENKIHELFTIINKKHAVFCRLVKGDSIECVIEKPQNALEIALLIKCYIKSLSIQEKYNKRLKYFKSYGIRIAIGLGKLSRYDKEKGVIDGEAIYLTGRKINSESTHNKKRISIKNTLFFVSKDAKLNTLFQTLFLLLDFILNKATSKQCEVVYYKILGYKEKEIASKLSITQPVVNKHAISVGWQPIEQAISYFKKTIKPN